MIDAIRTNDVDRVLELIQNGTNVKSQNYLHHAAAHNNTEIIHLLVDAGVNISSRDSHDKTALRVAVDRGNYDAIKMLVQLGADLNELCDEKTALHDNMNKPEMMLYLIDLGANVNTGNSMGNTPLHIAALYKDVGMCDMLLKRGAISNVRDNAGRTPLHTVLYQTNENPDDPNISIIIDLLKGAGASINAQTNKGDTALHLAINGKCTTAALLLLKYGANPRVVNKSGLTPTQSKEGTILLIEYMLTLISE